MKKITKLAEKAEVLKDAEMKEISGGGGSFEDSLSASSNNCSTSGACSGSCTITAGGQTFNGTCKNVDYGSFDFCTCVEN